MSGLNITSTLEDDFFQLYSSAESMIELMIERIGQESSYFSEKVLKTEEDEFMFNVGQKGSYIVEIKNGALICKDGYTYHFSSIDPEKFFKLVDHLWNGHKEKMLKLAQNANEEE